jgi:hypothetical protein
MHTSTPRLRLAVRVVGREKLRLTYRQALVLDAGPSSRESFRSFPLASTDCVVDLGQVYSE